MRLFKKQRGNQDVVPNQDFLHGTVRFVKGHTYNVDPVLADYFRNSGWLEDSPGFPPQAVSLDIDPANHGMEDSNG